MLRNNESVLAQSKRGLLRGLFARLWESKEKPEIRALREQLAAMDAAIAAKDAAIAAKDALQQGTFFTPVEQIWAPNRADFRNSFEKLRRKEGYYKSILAYAQIVSGVEDPITQGNELKPRILDKSQSANSHANRNGKNFTGGNGKEVGHQIPDAKTCAPTYGIGAQLTLGFDLEKFCADRAMPKATTILALQHIVCGNDLNRTFGLRSIPLNHLMVPKGHSEYFDDAPNWIIVPILSAEQIMEWKEGDDYWVMVLAKDSAAYKALVDAGYNDGIRKKCEKKDIETATTLLGDYMKAYADALAGRPDENGTPTSNFTPLDLFGKHPEAQKKCEVLTSVKDSLTKKYKVKIPIMKEFDKSWEVLKVNIRRDKDNQNIIPDPSNVAVKAAINCSFLYQQKLLPGCPNSQDAEEEDPLDVLAREFQESVEIQRTFAGEELHATAAVIEDDLSDDDDDYDNQSILTTMESENYDYAEIAFDQTPAGAGEEPRRVSFGSTNGG